MNEPYVKRYIGFVDPNKPQTSLTLPQDVSESEMKTIIENLYKDVA